MTMIDDGPIWRDPADESRKAWPVGKIVFPAGGYTAPSVRMPFPPDGTQYYKFKRSFVPVPEYPTELKIVKTDRRCHVPQRAHPGDAGLDLFLLDEVIMMPNQTKMIGLGFRVAIPSGYVGVLTPRSSTYRQGVKLANTLGWIDASYRGEVMLALQTLPGKTVPLTLRTEKAIAQLVLLPIPTPTVVVVDDLDGTERGHGGFGSTDGIETAGG